MIDRILIAYTRFRAAWAERQSERAFSDAMKKRREENGWFVLAFLVLVPLHACAHVTTSDVTAQHAALDRECRAEWARIEAMDAPADERLRLLDASGQRCREAGLEICEAHGTCGEFGR